MDADEDYAAYVGSRWAALVRPGQPIGMPTSTALVNAYTSSRKRRWWSERPSADLTERQTAEVLGVPTGTVKSRLARGLAQPATDTNLADLPGWSTP